MVDPQSTNERLRRALVELQQHAPVFTDDTYDILVNLVQARLNNPQATPSRKAPTPSLDEMRLVTLLFVDVSNSTKLLRTVEAEEWKVIMNGVHARITEALNQWNGAVGQYLGDGVLCFFGAQNSRDDDAHNAVSCALAMQQSLQHYAVDVEATYGVEFAARIGIGTGRVIVGPVGTDEKKERLAWGEATNLAARLQDHASPGGIVIDQATYRRVKQRFVVEPESTVDLRGFDEPVPFYSVLARQSSTTAALTATDLNGVRLPLVGRDAELSVMMRQQYLSHARQECHVVTVIGDIGTGKSRLLQEVIRLSEPPTRTLVMPIAYDQHDRPYNILYSLVEAACDLHGDLSSAQIRTCVHKYVTSRNGTVTQADAVAHLIGYGDDDTPMPDAVARQHVLDWWHALATSDPLLLVVDNLQWVDEASLSLLASLPEELAGLPLLLLMGGRPGYHSTHPAALELEVDARIERLTLEQVTPGATYKIVTTVLQHVSQVPQGFVQKIVERAEGNPLFVREFLNMMFEMGVFQPVDEGAWHFNAVLYDAALATVPNRLLNLLQARFDELTPQTRYILQTAAIVGRTFWSGAVAALSDSAQSQALLNVLAMRGIVIEQTPSAFPGEREYTFRHQLYRNVAYSMVPRNQQEKWHREAAAWLVQRVSTAPDQYPLLAHHFRESYQMGAALFTYVEAVEDHIQRGRLKAALGLVDEGLSIAKHLTREEALLSAIKLWVWRGNILLLLQRNDEATAACQSALKLLNEEVPDDQLWLVRNRAERLLGTAYTRLGRYAKAMAALERAETWISTQAHAARSEVLLAWSELEYARGDLAASTNCIQEAMPIVQIAQLPRQQAQVHFQRGTLALERGDFGQALQAYEAAQRLNDGEYNHAETLRALGWLHFVVFNVDRSLDYFRQAARYDASDPLLQAYRGLLLVHIRRVAEGVSLARLAVARGSSVQQVQQRIQWCHIGMLSRTGDLVSAREHAMTLIDTLQDDNPLLRGRVMRWLGLVNHRLGEPGAVQTLQEALQLEQAYGGRDVWLCANAIAHCLRHNDPAASLRYRRQAADALRAAAASLDEFPSVRESFLRHALVQQVFTLARA